MKVCTRSSSLLVSAALLALTATQSSVDAALDYNVKLYGINYDRRQGPDWDPKQCKNSDQVWSDMRMISEISNSVRIYGLDERGDPNSRDSCHTAHVLRAAKQYGMKVALGVWPGNNMPNELRKLENLLKAGLIDGNVMGLHVGSEAVYRKDYSADVAITYLNQARELLKRYGKTDLKLTIADVVDSYYQNPQLLQAVDYVSINQFSLWEKKDAREGMAIMLDRIRSIRMQAAKLGKEVVISETGWSSDGKDDRTGITSMENQKKYFEDFYHQATAHGLPYYWFAAIDLGWIIDQKVPDTSPVEAYFGVFDKYNNKKASFTNLNLKPRARTTFQLAANGRFLAETFDANKIEEVAGVETIAESNDKFTNLRYQWFFDQEKGMIRSLNSDRCLDAYQAWDGGIVHTYMCVDSERNQKWNYDASTKQLKHASHAGFCLDSAANGKLSLWSCSDSNANQEWVVSGVAVAESNAVRFFAKESTSFAQLVRVGENVAVGTGAAGAAGSEWIYDEATKLVKSKGSDYCLDAYEGWSGGRVHVWTCNAQEKNQQWTFDSGSGQLKHAKHTGFCLDRDPNGANGAGFLQLWGCHTNNFNQVWRKVSASAKAVRITGSDSSVVEFFSRDKLQLTPSGKRDSQTWFYNAFANTLLSKWGGECLDADQPYDNSIVHSWDCIATEGNQKWKLENGLIKHQKHTGFCLAFKNAAEKVLVLKTCSASDATQSFTLPAATA